METLTTRCCIAGGGPAGIMLGFLLARAGIDVVILEKHRDFLRDFRGDTIHPSTLELMYELGLLEEFLKRPHQQLREVGAQIGPFAVQLADFTHLPTHCKFIAFMPQWDFLNFIAESGRHYPSFRLLMNTEAVDVIEENGSVSGVQARPHSNANSSNADTLEIRADLVIAADGRGSTIRDKAGFAPIELGAPMDVLWMRLSKQASDPGQSLGRAGAGQFFIMLDRGDYWQCAYLIAKGTFDSFRGQGLPSFREAIVRIAPFFCERVDELQDWNQIGLLTVAVNRLKQWYRPGLLCIGDAAHAMSPIGGVGINMAIQDAVATANILASTLRDGPVSLGLLDRVQRRRAFPVSATQAMQVYIQDRVLTPLLAGTADLRKLPMPIRLLQRFPALRRIPARLIGMGWRPEHVHTPAV